MTKKEFFSIYSVIIPGLIDSVETEYLTLNKIALFKPFSKNGV